MMNTRTSKYYAILMVALSLTSFSLSAQTSDKKSGKSETEDIGNVQIFNGKDLSNWVFFLKDNTVNPATVFTVKNGIIHIAGSPFGYMRTKGTYSNYRLHIEWRWPSEATNSGVFVHCQTPDAIWLQCIECQLQAGNAGDFVCMNGADMNERTDKSSPVIRKKGPSSEKPVGEWNTMEVVCSGNTIEVYVNGILQNKGTNTSVSSGSISLQSEGKDIEFRNVFLTALKK
jgi:3-keto-disaccharide hydrolase